MPDQEATLHWIALKQPVESMILLLWLPNSPFMADLPSQSYMKM